MRRHSSSAFIVVGCGRLGAHVAARLSDAGNDVTVIDRDAAAFRGLPVDFSGVTLCGDATDWRVLQQAGLGEVDALLAATGRDNTNFMVSLLARRIGEVPRVLARVEEADREPIFRDAGIETICPLLDAATLLLDRLSWIEPQAQP